MAEIMIERVIPWTLNGEPQRPFVCTPEHLAELACGYLLTQCGLADLKQIRQAETDGESVAVGLAPGAQVGAADILTRLSGCKAVASGFTVSRESVRELCTRLLSEEEYFGTHRLVLRRGEDEVFREDVGRHNAADKCVAYGMAQGWDMGECVLGSTGRISLEMLAKAAVMGIPVFFSRKYPSDVAVEWAEKLGIAIVARAHSQDMAVYGASWRIT